MIFEILQHPNGSCYYIETIVEYKHRQCKVVTYEQTVDELVAKHEDNLNNLDVIMQQSKDFYLWCLDSPTVDEQGKQIARKWLKQFTND